MEDLPSIHQDLVLVINDVSYQLVDHGGTINGYPGALITRRDATPFILYNISEGATISETHLEDFRSRTDFLRLIVFYGAEESGLDLQTSAVQLLKETWKAGWEFTKFPNAPVFDGGLYVGYRGRIFQPWRIYHDENLTMTVTYQLHKGTLTGVSSLRIVVPPQSYSRSTPTPNKPLKGVTIAVKDMFDIEGSKTTLCNRAWAEYQSPKEKTAPSIKRLQDLGAWVVGKTRLNAMIIREETMECVERLAPHNPRGDGYQTSSGSSSGSCAAVGAYPWVDFAIGSDTVESLLIGMGVLQSDQHTAQLTSGPKTGTRILYPLDYLPTTNKAQMKFIDSFVEDLEDMLGTKRSIISLAELWRESSPESVTEKDLSEYLKTASCLYAGTLPYYKDAIEMVKEFYDGYTKEFGKTPFLHRALRWRWETADKVTPEERDEGWERIYTYRKWLLDNIFTEGSILVLPIDEGRPNYRDAPPPPFGLLSGYSSLYISRIAGFPEVTAPIGEIVYDSDITHREEPLPISVSVAAPPGTDLALIDLVHQTLEKGGKPIRLDTGRSIL
ncbi:hypothetical protein QQX98_009357 [Neonectria punicea]|uniref:Amidase domain-containing protein n=1 Tax=Neonectria punicea TaxID=979145 RepID=A0ABR1GSW6_9HYPO